MLEDESMGTIVIDNAKIRYAIQRKPNIRHVHLRMKPDSQLEVSLPSDSKVYVRTIIRMKKNWIKRKRDETTSMVKIVDGKQVLYQGVPYFLEPRRLGKRVKISKDKIRLPISKGMNLVQALKQWMGNETRKLVNRKLASYGKKYGFSPNGYYVKSMRKWAYCTRDGQLSFNWQLIGLPKELADYVILHELSHLNEFNHSRRFRYELASLCPDFREKEAILKRFVAD